MALTITATLNSVALSSGLYMTKDEELRDSYSKLEADELQNDGVDDEFRRGAKAMFDWFMFGIANNYHGNPEIQKQCDKENTLIAKWAKDALYDISPKDHAQWLGIREAYQAGYEAGKKSSANYK